MRIAIEVRAGEGGSDAKLLVKEQAKIYLRYAEKHGLQSSIISEHPSEIG